VDADNLDSLALPGSPDACPGPVGHHDLPSIDTLCLDLDVAAEWSHDGLSQDSAPAASGATTAVGLGSVMGSAPASGDATESDMLDCLFAELTAIPTPSEAAPLPPAPPYPQVVPGSPESGYGGDEQSASVSTEQLAALPALDSALTCVAGHGGDDDLAGLLDGCRTLFGSADWGAHVLPSAGDNTFSVVPLSPAL